LPNSREKFLQILHLFFSVCLFSLCFRRAAAKFKSKIAATRVPKSACGLQINEKREAGKKPISLLPL